MKYGRNKNIRFNYRKCKEKFDYESFVKDFAAIAEIGSSDIDIVENILWTILNHLAVGEKPNRVALQINNQFLLLGFMLDKVGIAEIENLISRNIKNWEKEIGTLKMITNMLNSNFCSVEQAYQMTEQLLSE